MEDIKTLESRLRQEQSKYNKAIIDKRQLDKKVSEIRISINTYIAIKYPDKWINASDFIKKKVKPTEDTEEYLFLCHLINLLD